MSRFTMTLAAAATSAVAAIAAVALPAVGADAPKHARSQAAPAGDFAAFVSCLHSHGLAEAPSDPQALKPWLLARHTADPDGVKAAMLACDNKAPDEKRAVAKGPDVQELSACLRAHGLDAPTAPDAFKRWLKGTADPSAVDAALRDCKMSLAPAPSQGPGKPGACGGDVGPAGKAAKPEAAKPGAAEQRDAEPGI
jgi:hypothetical protein